MREPDISAVLVQVRGLKRYFDVSPPLLTRYLSGQPPAFLKAVDGVSLDIHKGEILSLVGESGCGKSTLARLLVGLYKPTDGSVLFDGINIASADKRAMTQVRRRQQMIFQDPYASLNPRWRVRDIIAEPIRAFKLAKGRHAILDRVGELLRMVGLGRADGDKYPHEFSGGQCQRILIARALASQPEFLVCDEPTSALDVSVQAQILNLMKDLQREFGLTYLFISHNLSVVSHISERVGVMYLGRLVEVAPARTIFRTPSHPYTRMLQDAIPDIALTGRARIPVAGEVPNPIHPPSGCTFHPRCPFANPRCSSEPPELLPTAHGASVACHAVSEGRIAELPRFALPMPGMVTQ